MAREKKAALLDYTTGILLGLMLFLGGTVLANQPTIPGNMLSALVVHGSP